MIKAYNKPLHLAVIRCTPKCRWTKLFCTGLRMEITIRVKHVRDMTEERRLSLFKDVIDIADSVVAAYHPFRLNYKCFTNSLARIHWRIIPG